MSLPCARVQASGNPSALWKELGGGAVGSLASSPGGSEGKESTCNAGDLSSIPGWEDPLEKGTAIHSSILSWRIPWERSLTG